MTVEKHLEGLAENLVHELEPILNIKGVTGNPALLGAYTEAAITRLIRRVVHPLRVSTGAVIDFPMPDALKQIDVIVWTPFPAPGLFEVDAFALVPRSNAFGVLEIKRSNYSGIEDMLECFSEAATQLAAAPHERIGDLRHPGMGIVCVLEGVPSVRLTKLINENKVVAIFERRNKKFQVRTRDVLQLINFLHFVSWRFRMQSSQPEYVQIRLPSQTGNSEES